MQNLTLVPYYFLEVLKWLIVARVLLSWLPMLGIRLPPDNPITRIVNQITDPLLIPFQRYARVGMMDLSPIIVFFIIGFFQKLIVGGPLFQTISQTIALAVALLVSFTIHEFAHAWTATQLGDPTPGTAGRLTLNPLKHLDLLGTIMVLSVGFGWAKPVPVNPYYFRNGVQRGMAIVSAVGPLSNLGMAAVAAIPFKLGLLNATLPYSPSFLPSPAELLATFVWLNIILLVFNFLPIPPLDGFKVLVGLLPYQAAQSAKRLEPAGPIILLMLIFLGGPLFTMIITVPSNFIANLLI
jgi:Zn-dependent protease